MSPFRKTARKKKKKKNRPQHPRSATCWKSPPRGGRLGVHTDVIIYKHCDGRTWMAELATSLINMWSSGVRARKPRLFIGPLSPASVSHSANVYVSTTRLKNSLIRLISIWAGGHVLFLKKKKNGSSCPERGVTTRATAANDTAISGGAEIHDPAKNGAPPQHINVTTRPPQISPRDSGAAQEKFPPLCMIQRWWGGGVCLMSKRAFFGWELGPWVAEQRSGWSLRITLPGRQNICKKEEVKMSKMSHKKNKE